MFECIMYKTYTMMEDNDLPISTFFMITHPIGTFSFHPPPIYAFYYL